MLDEWYRHRGLARASERAKPAWRPYVDERVWQGGGGLLVCGFAHLMEVLKSLCSRRSKREL